MGDDVAFDELASQIVDEGRAAIREIEIDLTDDEEDEDDL
jgi:hypothetical protein